MPQHAAARRDLDALVRRLVGQPPETWMLPIVKAVVAKPRLKRYIEAVTLARALADSCMDAELVQPTLDLVAGTGLVDSATNGSL